MMGAIERMRILESKSSPSSRAGKEKEKQAMDFEEWHGEEKTEWEIAGFPPVSVGGLGRASSTLRRIGQVRGGEWGLGSGGKKKASSLRNERLS
jgi:hypothetical protein